MNPIRRRSLLGAGTATAALAASGWLAGCTGDQGGGGDRPKSLQDVPIKELGPETPDVHYPEGYVGARATVVEPFGDGSTEFRVVVPQDAEVVGDWNKSSMTSWFEKRTGVKIKFTSVLAAATDGSPDLTKVNAMLSSGDLPDAFLGLPFSNDQVSLYGQQGLFVALDEYIDVYAPHMRQLRTDYPGHQALTQATDGKVYQFAGINDCYHCASSPGRAWINQRYLDQVGAELPTTTEELREVLKLLQEKDPTPKRNLIPFAASVENPVDTFIMNAFLYNPGGTANGGWLALTDGRVEFVATKPEWREALRFLRTLHDDGTLGRDAFTMTDAALLQAGNQGRLGFVRAYYWGSFSDIAYKPGALWKDYVAVPPLRGPAGVQYARWDHFGYKTSPMVITSACKQPEILVQWADAQMELEAFQHHVAGNQGENWDWSKKGAKGINGKQALYELKAYPPPAGTSWNQYGAMYNSNDARLGIQINKANPNFEAELYRSAQSYQPFAEPEAMQVPPLIFNEADATAKADTAATIYNRVRTAMAAFAIGETDINDDGAWNEYVTSFDAIGIQAYLELHQQAYENRPK
ncbi:hypothetical protein [Microlunatus sp. GCM10028923]|uniref:hypothetical protein n=1 Tax=Microlunatus sp. GCM10028923 TaxID=3273400 RepID=UPI00360C98FE